MFDLFCGGDLSTPPASDHMLYPCNFHVSGTGTTGFFGRSVRCIVNPVIAVFCVLLSNCYD